jgi:hypothetical protein
MVLLVALRFKGRAMTFRSGVVVADTHSRGAGIVSAFTALVVASIRRMFVCCHGISLKADCADSGLLFPR